MNLEDCFRLGQIVKTHGVKGEVVAELDVEHPEEFENMESVFVEINQKLVPFFIDDINIGNKRAIIKFEDIESIEDAKILMKRSLYIPLEDLPEPEEGEFYLNALAGFKVKDKSKGEIGLVKEVIERPGQDLLSLAYGEKEIYIPVDKAIVLKVDVRKKIIQVDLPDGLLDL